MKQIKRMMAVLLVAALTSGWAVPAGAQENPLKVILEDAFYGGVIGTLIGGAMLAFPKHPGDHLEYIGYGAATGIIAGTVFGTVTVSRSFAEVDKGKVRFALPTVMPELQENGGSRGQSLAFKADLLRGTF